MQQQTAAPQQGSELDRLACRLEATGDYKVLRRIAPRALTLAPAPAARAARTGIIIDLETTGLDVAQDEVIELALVKFQYGKDDEILGLTATFQSFNEPSKPIPPDIVRLTGITDEMVAGHRIDDAALERFVADADVVIAHNAGFDRRFAERSWPGFAHKYWACSMTEIDWKTLGFAGTKLEYLLFGIGLFHSAHRAIDDCHALLELLARPLPGASTAALAALLDHARRPTIRIWAEYSPYDLKDALKRRGYRWSDGSDGRLKSWYIDVDADKRDAELEFLRREIYQRDVDVLCRELTALERFSNRA